MKRFILMFAVPAAAIAVGCSKNEVLPAESAPGEITFQTIETKAASSFSTANKFYSYAYYLPKDKAGWSANCASASDYISNSLIEYVSGKTAWKNASTSNYWPKQGSLTFFAWTDYSASPSVSGGTVSCAKDTGITFSGFSVTSNTNKDLMVADIAADQKENTLQYDSWAKGVPTIFRHILSNLVFTVRTDEQDTGVTYPDGTFKLQSITLKSVSTSGNYAQGSPAASTSPWSSQGTAEDLSAYSGSEVSVTKTAQTLAPASGDYSIVLPQSFSDETAMIEFVYTVTYPGTTVTESLTATKALKDAYTQQKWENGKRYTLNLIFGLKEILWDPDTTDWTDVNGGDINI